MDSINASFSLSSVPKFGFIEQTKILLPTVKLNEKSVMSHDDTIVGCKQLQKYKSQQCIPLIIVTGNLRSPSGSNVQLMSNSLRLSSFTNGPEGRSL